MNPTLSPTATRVPLSFCLLEGVSGWLVWVVFIGEGGNLGAARYRSGIDFPGSVPSLPPWAVSQTAALSSRVLGFRRRVYSFRLRRVFEVCDRVAVCEGCRVGQVERWLPSELLEGSGLMRPALRVIHY